MSYDNWRTTDPTDTHWWDAPDDHWWDDADDDPSNLQRNCASLDEYAAESLEHEVEGGLDVDDFQL